MNTPLHNLLRITCTALEGIRLGRHYNDAKNYKGPRDLPADEAATLLEQHLVGFALDWRRVESGLPDDQVAVLMALAPIGADDQPEVREGWSEHGVWFFADGGSHVENRVYAWAHLPAAPSLKVLQA
jgi:hypothetical protein